MGNRQRETQPRGSLPGRHFLPAQPTPPTHRVPTHCLIVVSSNTGYVGQELESCLPSSERGYSHGQGGDRKNETKQAQWSHGNDAWSLLPVPRGRGKGWERREGPRAGTERAVGAGLAGDRVSQERPKAKVILGELLLPSWKIFRMPANLGEDNRGTEERQFLSQPCHE